ncbi:hypothetical protein KJ691_00535, partial [bacterium]|nr:hypothetical protein [bacterium]
MSGIASSAGDLAGTKAGAKTASDIQTVSKFDSADDFIESEVKKASAKATVDKVRYEKDLDQASTQSVVDEVMDRSNDKEAIKKVLIDSGAATLDKEGRLKATTGKEFSDALSMVPGVGTIASSAIDAGLYLRDKQSENANIPLHIQNAFNTPTGHNTSEAMKAGLVKTEDIKPVHTEAKSAQPIMAEILTVVILPAQAYHHLEMPTAAEAIIMLLNHTSKTLHRQMLFV